MASRADIRDGIVSELTSLSGTYNVTDSVGNVIDTVTLSNDDIGLRDPEYAERIPAIVYHEDYRTVQMNDVGTGPDMVLYTNSGAVSEEHWREYMEAQYIIDVRAANEVEKEPIYEALRRQFSQYQFDPWDETSIHSDVIDVDVLDSTSIDTGDEEDVIRGDQLEVRVQFYRTFVLDTDNITKVETQVDADNDGTNDFTRITN